MFLRTFLRTLPRLWHDDRMPDVEGSGFIMINDKIYYLGFGYWPSLHINDSEKVTLFLPGC